MLTDFPRLEQWSENTFLSDASLFMDGFLYISSGPAKTTVDRRGKDGECECRVFLCVCANSQSISAFVSDLKCVFVRAPIQLSTDRSISVNLSAVKLPIVKSVHQTVQSERSMNLSFKWVPQRSSGNSCQTRDCSWTTRR